MTQNNQSFVTFTCYDLLLYAQRSMLFIN